jgi:hypothetical protein
MMTREEALGWFQDSILLLDIPEEFENAKKEQIETCWAGHDDPNGNHELAEIQYWERRPLETFICDFSEADWIKERDLPDECDSSEECESPD